MYVFYTYTLWLIFITYYVGFVLYDDSYVLSVATINNDDNDGMQYTENSSSFP